MQPHDSGEGFGEALEQLLRARDVPLSRRDALRLLAGAGLYSLAGCAPAPPPRSAPAACGPGRGPYPIVIDAHTHVFNVRDVPAAEYFIDSIAHLGELKSGLSLAPGQVRFIRELALHLTRGLARLAPGARDERETLLEMERRGDNPFSAAHARPPLGAGEDMCAWRLRIREILRTLPLTDARRLAESLGACAAGTEAGGECGPGTSPRPDDSSDPCGKATPATYGNFPETIARVFVQIESFLFGDRARLTTLAGLAGLREYGPTLNLWLRRMARPRHEIARELVGTYGVAEEGGGDVDAFVVAMVDMQNWLGGGTDPLADQVLLIREIARLGGGRLLPFVAYDPLRDVRENGAALRLVREAVDEHGFVGVKLYPANGFRPLGNASLDDDFPGLSGGGDAARDLGRELDARLHALYAWCSASGVPVMAHGNESMGTLRRYSERGAPTLWRRVAERYPALRVNIGHFGGMESLTERHRITRELLGVSYMSLPGAPENWAIRILELMTEHPHVYSDVGAFKGILNKEHAFNTFGENLRGLTGRDWYPAGMRQLMYGSDWYMLATAPRYADYYRRFEELVRRWLHREAAAAFVGQNAAVFLGLRPGEPNRRRLDAFYRAHGVAGAWRCKVDAWANGSASG